MLSGPMTENPELLDYLLLLRYGPASTINEKVTMLSVTAIAKVVSISPGMVEKLLKLALKQHRTQERV